MQATGSGKQAFLALRLGMEESISCLETTRIKDPGLSKSSHELEPQEFQVNMNGEETRLGRSLDTRNRLLFTTDLKAVGL